MKKELLDILEKLLCDRQKCLLGICGAPGAGKSTIAAWLVAEWNKTHGKEAVLVPMDGYHLDNERLEEKGLLHLKGIPDTFDAEGFVEKIRAIKNQPTATHFCPRFDRSIETSIENAIAVSPQHRLVVVEGNYLLLNDFPWSELKGLFDEVWMIDSDDELILPRLLSRHRQGGKTESEAMDKVSSTDLPNAKLVAACKSNATRVFNARDLMSN